MPFVLAGLIVILVVLIILGGLDSKPSNENEGQQVADAGTPTKAQDKPVDWKDDGVDINKPDKKPAGDDPARGDGARALRMGEALPFQPIQR